MAGLNFFWTSTAIKQRNYTFEYWNNRNKSTSYSKRLNKKIKERTALLCQNPEMGKQTDFKDARVISLGHYSIVYSRTNARIINYCFLGQ